MKFLGIGDWGFGDWPNPQSPIPNPQLNLFNLFNLIICFKFQVVLIYLLIKFNYLQSFTY